MTSATRGFGAIVRGLVAGAGGTAAMTVYQTALSGNLSYHLVYGGGAAISYETLERVP